MNNSSPNIQLQQTEQSTLKMEEHEATEKTVDDNTEVGPEDLPDDKLENRPFVPLVDMFSRLKLPRRNSQDDGEDTKTTKVDSTTEGTDTLDDSEPGPMPKMEARGSFAVPMLDLKLPDSPTSKKTASDDGDLSDSDDSEPGPAPNMEPRASFAVPMLDLKVLDTPDNEESDDSEPEFVPTKMQARVSFSNSTKPASENPKVFEHQSSLSEPEPVPELSAPPSFKAVPFHGLNASLAERRAKVQRRQDSRKKKRRQQRKPVRMSWRRGSVSAAELSGLLGVEELGVDDDEVAGSTKSKMGKSKRRASKASAKSPRKPPTLERIDSSVEEPEPVGMPEPVKMMPFVGLELRSLVKTEASHDDSTTHDETDRSMSPGPGIKPVVTVDATAVAEEASAIVEEEPVAIEDVELSQLKKHKILGEGIFGQVWMVSDSRKKVKPIPYALKIQSKYELVQAEQAHAIVHEKEAMEAMHHPFIMGLVKTFQDPDFIYILLEFLRGGELFTVLHGDLGGPSGLPEEQAKFYSICVADAVAHIHSKKYVYRDLKPENVMIDELGYPVVIDFGCAKLLEEGEKTYTLVGTPRCVPPEIINSTGHDWSADHWSLGILFYELVTGENPFFFEGMDQMSLFHSIEHDDYPAPEDLSEEGKDLISKLLQKEATKRLGSLEGGEDDILKHPWFEGMFLDRMRRREMRAPWIPTVTDMFDTSNFDDWSDLEDKTLQQSMPLDRRDAELFKDF